MKSNWTLSVIQTEEIEKIIGYRFKDKELLSQCFTLASASKKNNERLEWFGDAVVDFCVSEILFRKSNEDEGGLTELRKEFVKDDVLRPAVERLGLDKYLIYEGKRQNLGEKPVASLFEAVVGGIYVDGGMKAAKKFIVEKLVKPQSEELLGRKRKQNNYKGVLQEYLQGMGMPRAQYVLTERQGPDHSPVFTVKAEAQGRTATGKGGSKTAAEQAAAKKLLETLRKGN